MKNIFLLGFVSVLYFSMLGFVFAQTGSQTPSTPGMSYCSSKYSSSGDISACISCIANGMTDWGGSCVPIEQLCTNVYSIADDQAKCSEKYTSCRNSWWPVERCSCKAVWWISLNTNVPFVGNCISLRATPGWWSNTTIVTPTTAFPRLLAWLTKIVMTIILIFCFMAIIAGGVLISMGGASEEQAKKGKDLIKHVVMALALLGASGVILRVINPSFFS